MDTKVSNRCKWYPIHTTVYRKKTDTGVILNETAVAPEQWKRGLANCFLHRAEIVCSDEKAQKAEISKLGDIFYENNYPSDFFDRAVNQFKKNKHGKEIQSEVKKKPDMKLMIKIPFIGKPSVLFAKRLSNLIKNSLNEEIFVVYETTKVKDSFKIKDRIPKEICSQIVYKFTCPGDPDTSYIGHTIRSLRERTKEHLNPTNGTAIGNHIFSCEKCQESGASDKDFVILRRCRNRMESAIQEALLIKRQKPILNKQFSNSTRDSFTLKIFN